MYIYAKYTKHKSKVVSKSVHTFVGREGMDSSESKLKLVGDMGASGSKATLTDAPGVSAIQE